LPTTDYRLPTTAMKINDTPRITKTSSYLFIIFLLSFLIYYFSNPLPGSYYDYTARIASAMLHGDLGVKEQPPSWLNEMVPFDGRYYSAFPLGSVLTMMPIALLRTLGLIDYFPGVFLAALLAGIATVLLYAFSSKYGDSDERRLVLTLFPIFGTCLWANLAYAGAWHIALGAAMVGQLAALYFILLKPSPLLAGFFFAIAFGNRTEIILLAPIFIYLIYRGGTPDRWRRILRFIAIPLLLGCATLAYNYARFGSVIDFGYARIPGVLDEPWYRHGIFSISAIPGNAEAMLWEPWRRLEKFPYLVPSGFGGSIFLSSPYLIYLFRRGARDSILKWLAWGALAVLTLVLWCHGNTGGWQFSYRYSIELLPWIFLILLESSRKRVSPFEVILLAASIAINGWGAYLFLRTDYLRPS
ncbi:MAG: hypothetical protein J2P41_18325, partial [Blastocatellia bacterium]|nr:hypothetical protein [Blastocatellia bacterium]